LIDAFQTEPANVLEGDIGCGVDWLTDQEASAVISYQVSERVLAPFNWLMT